MDTQSLLSIRRFMHTCVGDTRNGLSLSSRVHSDVCNHERRKIHSNSNKRHQQQQPEKKTMECDWKRNIQFTHIQTHTHAHKSLYRIHTHTRSVYAHHTKWIVNENRAISNESHGAHVYKFSLHISNSVANQILELRRQKENVHVRLVDSKHHAHLSSLHQNNVMEFTLAAVSVLVFFYVFRSERTVIQTRRIACNEDGHGAKVIECTLLRRGKPVQVFIDLEIYQLSWNSISSIFVIFSNLLLFDLFPSKLCTS